MRTGFSLGPICGIPDSVCLLFSEMAELANDPHGRLYIDTTGTILWCNEALAQYFEYDSSDDLVSENVRILMPPPYSKQHDAILARYTL